MSGPSAVLGAAALAAAVCCCLGQLARGAVDENVCYSMGSVYYPADGRCHKLGLRGPCAEDQLLFLDEPGADSVQVTPVCKKCRCCHLGSTAVYWNATGKCLLRVTDGANVCPDEGTELRADYFGDGECGCVPGHERPRRAGSGGGAGSAGGGGWGVQLSLTTAAPVPADGATGRCWPLLERGPCARDQVLLPGGGCGADPCARENAAGGRPGRGRAVLLDGQCRVLGSSCPRRGAPAGAKVGLNPATGNPTCLDGANNVVLNLVSAPDNCNTAVGGGACEKVVAVPDGKDYVNILLQAAERKRRKRRARGGAAN